MKRTLLNKANVALGMIVGWSTLGFYRGVKEYDYFDLMSNRVRKAYLYSDILNNGFKRIGGGLYGVFIYINPFLLCVTIPREIYRLEVNLRGLDFEKETDTYKRMI